MARSQNYSPSRALRRFGFRQTIRGALIIGWLTGIMMGAQGAAYVTAYPDQHSRDIFVASLRSMPAVGFMSGEIDDALTPASYSIYKSIALTTLIVSVWGLLVVTRLSRGQEEDGRLEPLLAGAVTRRSVTIQLLIGFGYSLTVAFIIAWVMIAGLGALPNVELTPGAAALLALGVFLPGFFFAAFGVLTSQLALTRGRAVAYGLVPLLTLFMLRGTANSVSEWNWLKQWSPFGWTDLLNPVRHPAPEWIIPTVIFAPLFICAGLYLVSRRDFGASVLPQSTHVKSRFFLLSSDFTVSIRQNIIPFFAWCTVTLAYAGLLASVAKVGADALASSPTFTQVMAKLGGTYDDLVIAFLGFGGLFTTLILLVMTAVCMSSLRNQEAKGYLDNFLVQPIGRSKWLIGRIIIIIGMATIISLLAGYVIWQIATAQGVAISLGIMLQNALALTGTIILLVGIGTFLYGLLPRFASIGMFVVIIWAFVVDVLKSLLSLNDWIDKTSLLHYVSFAPTKSPDCSTFLRLVCIGVFLITIGVWCFTKRDIVSE